MKPDDSGGARLGEAGCRAGTKPERALELAYRYLNRREHTAAEVRRHLFEREIDPAEADGAIEELIDQGALDDVRFARLFAQDKRTLEQWGEERIRRGLQARGLDREQIEHALAEPPLDGEPPRGELDRALALLRRRFPEPPKARRDRERALGVLLRKGYEYELAVDAVTAHSGSAE